MRGIGGRMWCLMAYNAVHSFSRIERTDSVTGGWELAGFLELIGNLTVETGQGILMAYVVCWEDE